MPASASGRRTTSERKDDEPGCLAPHAVRETLPATSREVTIQIAPLGQKASSASLVTELEYEHGLLDDVRAPIGTIDGAPRSVPS
jgi:hypothetical protein